MYLTIWLIILSCIGFRAPKCGLISSEATFSLRQTPQQTGIEAN